MTASEPKSTLYLRSLPRGLVRKVKAKAAEKGTTLTGFVRQSLEKAIAEHSVVGVEDERFALDQAWFERNLPKLRARYEGAYVAILDGSVVDHDEDFGVLAERVFARHGVRSILMPRVGAVPERLRLRSPRFAPR